MASIVSHQRCQLVTGVDMHYMEALPASGVAASGVTCLLIHGFPDTAYGWRHQLLALSAAGHRALAPDMRGYGETILPAGMREDAASYCTQALCSDMVALLDALLIDKVVVMGHDWGGTVVWNFAVQPETKGRCLGVAAFCTPFFNTPEKNPWPKILADPGRFDYQVYFQTKEAEKEFEADLERTVACMFRGSSDADKAVEGDFRRRSKRDAKPGASSSWPIRPTKDGGYFVRYPPNMPRSAMLSEADAAYYVAQFRKTGFFGILSWYRNVERNWRWNLPLRDCIVEVPALMVCATNDEILPPSMTKHMGKQIPDLRVEEVLAGHWVLQETPHDCNRHVLDWLRAKFPAQPAANL